MRIARTSSQAVLSFLVYLWGGLLSASLSAAQPVEEPRAGAVTSPVEIVQPPAREVDLPRTSPLRELPNLPLLPTASPPRIDGKLDDACWTSGPISSEFRQVDPKEGAAPTERTEIRARYDANFLYLGVRCFDREPARIVATQMQSDADVSTDDSVTIVFDTFGLKRDGYMFILTPRGAKLDALIGSGGTKVEWDAIWEGAARIDEEGWVAEFAIPFKSVSFGPAGTPWGFNVERVIRRNREVVRWASPFKNKTITSLADAGRLEGFTGINRGLGIDVQPFLVARYRHEAGLRREFEFEPGVDVFFRPTPSLTAAITINTDFAETEVDERRVNLTRFPLFFPEKRDFFLQDAGIFAFGAGNTPIAFHSRRIGLAPNGRTIDIIAGGKLTGRIGDLTLGLMDVQVASGEGIPEKNLAVARASYHILEESDVGGIFTYGDPTRRGDNFLVGADFNYRNSHFIGHNALSAHAWVLKSGSNDTDGSEMAFGGAIVYPNEPWRFDLYASQIDEDFNPALGFVKRTGIREYGGLARYRWRPSGALRTVDLEIAPYWVTNLANETETELWTGPTLTLTNHPGDAFSIGFIGEREVLFDPFEIVPGVVIPVGDYRFNRVSATLATSTARPLSLFSTVSFGEFYDGTREEYDTGIEWRVSPHLFLGASWELNVIDLPVGEFDVHVGALKVNIAFSPRVSWNTLVQYDNQSDSIGINSRFRWIVKPGSDVFLVFNRGFDVNDRHFHTASTEVTGKLVWTFRF